MSLAVAIFAGITIGGFLVGAWMLICNNRTYTQRSRMDDWVFSDRQNWSTRLKVYERVSYERHMHRLMMFGDPAKLYSDDPETVAMFRNIFKGKAIA